jgi:membrane-associated phospholipid phosphatase
MIAPCSAVTTATARRDDIAATGLPHSAYHGNETGHDRVRREGESRLAAVVAGASLPGAIGTSRLILGVHWPSDVLAALALGFGISLAVTITAAVFARLTPPPVEQTSERRRSLARLTRLLTLQRRVHQRDLGMAA